MQLNQRNIGLWLFVISMAIGGFVQLYGLEPGKGSVMVLVVTGLAGVTMLTSSGRP